jgi:hypothetical protein
MKVTDYTSGGAWLSWPAAADKAFDVFYLYPTAWEAKSGQGPLCGADYRLMRSKARFLLAYQATAFSAGANLYAPYYRQYDARHLLTMDCRKRAELTRAEPWADVRAAFEHYLAHCGGERPLVLAGHSQGAMLIKDLLYSFLKNRPELIRRLAVAYVIGFSVSRGELAANPEFPFARGAEDAGVIVSYNTESLGVHVDNPVVTPDSAVINPGSWVTSEEPAPADRSAGSRIIDRLGRLREMKNLADARLDLKRGVVVCSTFDQEAFYGADVQVINPFPPGVLHIYDIALYYHDLRADVGRRVRTLTAGTMPQDLSKISEEDRL